MLGELQQEQSLCVPWERGWPAGASPQRTEDACPVCSEPS